MIDMEYIRGFYPPYIAQNAGMQKHMLKEYVELLALECATHRTGLCVLAATTRYFK